jgi:hypothetical protein
VEGFLELLYHLPVSDWLRQSRWGYASVSATHILALALLTGTIAAYDLRLIGYWNDIPAEVLERVLTPVAGCGLLLAVASGTLLFMTRAPEYAGLTLFLVKMALVAAGTLQAALSRLRGPPWKHGPARMRRAGITSLLIWLGVLVCGRMLAFVGD